MRRAIIFAHFDRDGLIDPHVKYYLAALRKHAVFIVFVSTSALESELESIRSELVDIAVTRENVGYDFLSWKFGYSMLGEKSSFDEIVFANDSVYGPMFDLTSIFEKAQSYKYPFWGLVKSHEIEVHIQSYFFCFSKELIDAGVVDGFWDSVDIIEDKEKLIREYEIGMTRYIRRFIPEARIGCFFDQSKLGLFARLRAGIVNGRWRRKSRFGVVKSAVKGRVRNPCHQFWRSMLESGVPFLKVELIRDNPEGLDLRLILKFISKTYLYPPELISSHMHRISSVDDALG